MQKKKRKNCNKIIIWGIKKRNFLGGVKIKDKKKIPFLFCLNKYKGKGLNYFFLFGKKYNFWGFFINLTDALEVNWF